MSETMAMRVPVEWTNDCQGKKDYDGELVCVSTRYWPRGGGFDLLIPGEGFTSSAERFPEIRPSAKSTIYLGSTTNAFYDDAVRLAEREFEADTEDDVKAQVETWVAEQFSRIAKALRAEFAVPPTEEA